MEYYFRTKFESIYSKDSTPIEDEDQTETDQDKKPEESSSFAKTQTEEEEAQLAQIEIEKLYKELLVAREQEQLENSGITNVLGCGSPELLVLAAEAALRSGNLRVARAALDEFFLQGCPKNQFFCRAYFAKALVDSESIRESTDCRGIEAIHRIVEVAMVIVNGIHEVCFEPLSPGKPDDSPRVLRPRYNFLIYNGSVHLWNVTRPLQRQGVHARKHLVAPFAAVSTALDLAEDPNIPWRIQLKLALALALDEAGRSGEAQEVVRGAQTLLKRNDSILELERQQAQGPTEGRSSISESAAVTQARLAGVVGVNVPPGLRRGVEETLVHVLRHVPGDSVKAANTAQDKKRDVRLTVQCVRNGSVGDVADVEKALREAVKTVMGPGAEDEETEGAERAKQDCTDMLCEVGIVALENGLYEVASECQAHVEKFKGVKKQNSIVLFDLFQARMLVYPDAVKAHVEELRKKIRKTQGAKWEQSIVVSRRIEALKILESAVQSGLRFQEYSLVEQACIAIWNIALPLLQDHLRKFVQKPFHIAVSALEEIESCKVLLRARLHTEVAKCEIASDFIAKASVHALKALEMDYGLVELDESEEKSLYDEEKKAHLQRPLDRTLESMIKKLQLRSNIYNEPDTALERAILSIEQAKDAREYHLKHSLLVRAVRLLDHKTAQPSGRGVGGAPSIAEVESFLAMWGEVARLAWDSRMVAIAQSAALKVTRASRGRDGGPVLGPDQDACGGACAGACEQAGEGDWRAQLVMDWDPLEHKAAMVLKAQMHLLAVDTIVYQMRAAEEDESTPLLGDLGVRALGIEIPEEMIAKVKRWELLYSEDSVADSGRANFASVDEEANANEDDDEENEYWFDTNLPKMKENIIWHIAQCLRIGKVLQEGWIVDNACCYLWNYHFHAFLSGDRAKRILKSLVSLLREAEEYMAELQVFNVPLYCSICEALASALEHRENKLEEAVEITRKGIELASVQQSRRLIGTLHRVQRIRGESEKLPDDSMQRIFAVLELAKLDEQLLPASERRTLLVEAIEGFRVETGGVVDSSDETSAEEGKRQKKPKHVDRVELVIELWTKLGLEALRGNLIAEAIECLQQAVSTIPTTTSACLTVAPKIWRWYSVAESAFGIALSKTISSSRQEVTLQDEIREQAFTHFVEAAKCGVRAKRSELVIEAAKHFWNAGTSFLGSKITRSMLIAPTNAILGQVETIPLEDKDQDSNELQLRLYGIQFQCLQDKEEWTAGLEAVRHAFRFVPQAFHTPLWQARVLFSSKLGLDSVGGISKMKDVDASTQAKAFATLARKSVNPGDQLNAYQSALELLEDSFERVGYCIEFAEWLHAQHFALSDVRNVLLSAADLLLDVEYPGGGEDEDEENEEDDKESVARSRASRFTARTGNTAQTRKSGRTTRSRGKAASRSGRSRAGRSAGNKSVRSRRSGRTGMTGRSRRSERSGRTRRTDRSKRTGRTAKSSRWDDSEAEEDEEDPGSFPEALAVPHLLDLVQVLVMLARIAGTGTGQSSPEEAAPARAASRAHYVELASHYMVRLWALCVETANQVAQKSAEGGESVRVPEGTEEWLAFCGRAREVVRTGASKPGQEELTLHPAAVPFPAQRIHYLRELLRMQRECALDHLCFPVLCALDCIVEHVVAQPHFQAPLRVILLVERARALDRIGHASECRAVLEGLPLDHVHESAFAELRDDVAQLERQSPDFSLLATVAPTDGLAGEAPPPLTAPCFFRDAPQARRENTEGFTLRSLWREEAACLLEVGEVACSRALLGEAMRHANAHRDLEVLADALEVHARLLQLEGDATWALNRAVEAWRCRAKSGGNSREWLRTAETVAAGMVKAGHWREAITVLDGLACAVGALPGGRQEAEWAEARKRVGEADMDTCHAAALTQLGIARVYVDQALKNQRNGTSAEARSLLSSAVHRFQLGCEQLEKWGEPVRFVFGVLEMAQAVLRLHSVGLATQEGLADLAAWLQRAKVMGALLYETRVPPAAASTTASSQLGAMLVEVEARLGQAALAQAKLAESQEAESSSRMRGDSRSRQASEKSVEDKYLLDTAPEVEPTTAQLGPPPAARALAHFSSALVLSQRSGPVSAEALCAVGAALVRASLVSPEWKGQQHAVLDPWSLEDVARLREARLVAACAASQEAAGRDELETAECAPPTTSTLSSAKGIPRTASTGASRSTAQSDQRQAEAGAEGNKEEDEEPVLELGENDLDPMKRHATALLRRGLKTAAEAGDDASVLVATQALMDSHGHVNAAVTVESLFLMQSIKAKQWLATVWERATVHSDPCLLPSLFMEQRSSLSNRFVDLESTKSGSIVRNFFRTSCLPVRMMDCSTETSHVLATTLDVCKGRPDQLPKGGAPSRPGTVATSGGSAPSRPGSAATTKKPARGLDSTGGFDESDAMALVLTLCPITNQLYGGIKCKGSEACAASRAVVSSERLVRIGEKMVLFSKTVARFMLNYGNDKGKEGEYRETMEPWETPTVQEEEHGEQLLEEQGSNDTVKNMDIASNATIPKGLVDCESTETLMSVEEGLMDPEEMLKSIAGELAEHILVPLLNGSPKFASLLKEVALYGKALLLVADDALARLPILLAFDMLGFSFPVVVRDFSVHMLFNRLAIKQKEEETPGLGSVGVRYIADPRCESNEQTSSDGSMALSHVMKSIASDHSQVTFSGFHGQESCILGPKDWHESFEPFMDSTLQEKGGATGNFLYLGFGNIFSYVEPKHLSGLSTSRCSMAVLLDRMTNEVTSRREAKIKTSQSRERLKLEEPFEIAAILSLIGAKAVILNQWATTQHANERILDILLTKGPGPKAGDAQLVHELNRTQDDSERRFLQRVRFNILYMGDPNAAFGK